MHLVTPAARSLRTLIELGSDRFWFAGAVILGLFVASWVGHLVLASLVGPLPVDGLGF